MARTLKEAYEYMKSKGFREIEEVRWDDDNERIYVIFSVSHWRASDFCDSLEYVKEFLNNLGYDYSTVYFEIEREGEK